MHWLILLVVIALGVAFARPIAYFVCGLATFAVFAVVFLVVGTISLALGLAPWLLLWLAPQAIQVAVAIILAGLGVYGFYCAIKYPIKWPRK